MQDRNGEEINVGSLAVVCGQVGVVVAAASSLGAFDGKPGIRVSDASTFAAHPHWSAWVRPEEVVVVK